MAKSLSALPVGSVVKSANTKYNGQAIRWIVGTQDTSQGRTGLVTEKMITLKCFDAKESGNSNSDRRSYGNNRYSVSNIDKWLNSAAASWYAAQHGADAPPTSANCWNGYNPYDTEAGFLANFEAGFQERDPGFHDPRREEHRHRRRRLRRHRSKGLSAFEHERRPFQ